MKEVNLEIYREPTEDSAVQSRRGFLQLVLASAASAAIASLVPDLCRAEGETAPEIQSNPFEVGSYTKLEGRFYGDLTPDSPKENADLAGVVDELPYLYYDHDVQGKIVDRKGRNIATASISFELSKLVWRRVRDEVKNAKANDKILQKLKLAAQPGVPIQERLQSVYDTNTQTNGKIRVYWEAMEKEAMALVKTVQGLVLQERAAARGMKTPSQANSVVSARALTPTTPKDEATKKKHADEFDDYSDIEYYLQPGAYECDSVSPSLTDEPSSILGVEALKTLKVMAKAHLNAAVQRKEVYHAIQSFVLLNPKERQTLKYDGTRYNDKILKGWLELLRETPDGKGVKGKIEELLDHLIITIQAQSTEAEAIGRCENAK